jgi:CheY-like chemotaxis protein
VRVAGNGLKAVQILSDGPEPPPFDLVLMDLQMPEMDGYQATAKLRAESRFASLPIIAMTAHATVEERQRCLAAGMNDHVAKPIDPAVLFDTLGRYYRPAVEPAVRTAAPAEGPRHDATLPPVEGLDAADGLLRVAGNRKLYLKLLRQFVEQQGQAPAHITDALAAGDHATAERLAHMVKGVAGNLGAAVVQAAAGALEQAIAGRGDTGRIDVLRQRLADELGALIGRLRPALGDEPALARPLVAAPPTDPEALKSLVAQMRKQLSEFDPAAADFLEANRESFRSLLQGDDFTEFERHVQGYAFGEAQLLLERVATGI